MLIWHLFSGQISSVVDRTGPFSMEKLEAKESSLKPLWFAHSRTHRTSRTCSHSMAGPGRVRGSHMSQRAGSRDCPCVAWTGLPIAVASRLPRRCLLWDSLFGRFLLQSLLI